MDIVFCKTRADPEFYRSYTDFWSLVELAGFPWMWLDELEPGRDAVYIVTPRNGELPPILPRLQGDRACKFVWWCLERPDAQGSVTRGQVLEEGIDELWLSDRWLANLHRERGWGPVRFVPLGSHEGLQNPPEDLVLRQYDWAHMSYANGRRLVFYDRIEGKLLPNCWDEERHEGLRRTFWMVNAHQDHWPVIEPLRFALAAAYGMGMITETIKDAWPCRPDLEMIMAQTLWLTQTVNRYVPMNTKGARKRWSKVANSLHLRLCHEFEFGKCVREAVACLG